MTILQQKNIKIYTIFKKYILFFLLQAHAIYDRIKLKKQRKVFKMELKYTVPEITPETLEYYVHTNHEILVGTPRSIVLIFHGLGSCGMKHDNGDLEKRLAENGVLSIYPYYGPWSWMNAQAVRYVDKVIEVACARHGLDPDKTPIIIEGGSMGGHSALVYTRYAKRTPKACVTNCPVCDFAFHATEREDLPRTIYLAFEGTDRPLGEEIMLHSAYHLAPTMPDIPYVVLHGTRDGAVNKEIHSDRFVKAMRELGRNIEYIEVEGMEHCWMEPFPEAKEKYISTIVDFAIGKR